MEVGKSKNGLLLLCFKGGHFCCLGKSKKKSHFFKETNCRGKKKTQKLRDFFGDN